MIHSSRRLQGWLILIAMLSAVAAVADEPSRQSRTMVGMQDDAAKPSVTFPVQRDLHDALRLQGYREDVDGLQFTAGLRRDGVGLSQCYPYDWQSRRVIIDDAEVALLSDDDSDGYFQGFRLALELDSPGSTFWVYLRLYLSYQGGPWNIMHQSRDFRIDRSAFTTDFSLTTWLDYGYPTGYYDIRVDILDADSACRLMSYGPYDDLDLSSLPLEDRQHDDFYYGYGYDSSLGYDVSVHGSGALGPWALIGVLLFGMLRRHPYRSSNRSGTVRSLRSTCRRTPRDPMPAAGLPAAGTE